MKKIDDDLGGTTPLNIILSFQMLRVVSLTMNFLSGMRIQKRKKINLSIGLQEIKWIKF